MVNTEIIPVYSNGTEMVELEDGVFNIINGSNLKASIIDQVSIKSNYANYKNTFVILLLFYVIGNSAPYYYFENLRNKDAWPSHGLGGLFRKLFVHIIGICFAYSLLKYITSSINTFKSGYDILESNFGCTYINNPYPIAGINGKQVICIPLGDKENIDNTLFNLTEAEGIKALYKVHLNMLENLGGKNITEESITEEEMITSEEYIDKTINVTSEETIEGSNKFETKSTRGSWFLFLIIVFFTVIFSNIITLKGYPIYGVTHMYNPLSCFRFGELPGYLFGSPAVMQSLGKYLNPLCGHTHYGVKSSMYDAYKMRNIPVYDMGFNSNEDMGIWGLIIGGCNFLWCIALRLVQIVYIYTSASIFLNPLTAFVLCIVGYVSATPMVFVGGSNAITALNKKIDMFFLRRWLYYFTQGRCYKGNVLGGVLRKFCTFGFDTWVADAIFNNEQLGLACENTFGEWWRKAWDTWKCVKPQSNNKNSTEQKKKDFKNKSFKEILSDIVRLITGGFIGDNPFGGGLRSYIETFNEDTSSLKKFIFFSLYYATTILQNLLGIGAYKNGKGTYFGNLLRTTILYFIATSIYSTKNGQLSFGNTIGFSGGMKFLNYILVGIVLCMLTLTSNTEYGIDLPNMSLILDPTLSFIKGIRGSKSSTDTQDTQQDTPQQEQIDQMKYTAPFINCKEINEKFRENKGNIAKKIYDIGRTKFMSFYYDLLVSVKSGLFDSIDGIDDIKIDDLKKNLNQNMNDPSSIYDLTNIYYKVVKLLDNEKKEDGTELESDKKIMCQRFRYEFENLRIETGCYDQAASKTPTNKITRFMKNAPSKELTDLLQKILRGANKLQNANQINKLIKFLELMNQDVDKISFSNLKELNLPELSEIFERIGIPNFLSDLKKFMPIDALITKIKELNNSEQGPEKELYTKLQNVFNKYEKSNKESNSTAVNNTTISDQYVITKSDQVATKSATKTSVMEQLRGELEKQKEYFENNDNSELGKILKALEKLEEKKRGMTTETNNLEKKLLRQIDATREVNKRIDAQIGGAGTAQEKPKQNTPTLYNPLNCNDFDGSCCPQDATGFGTVMNEDVTINSLDGKSKPKIKSMNVFKSKICNENFVKSNMDDGELYCLDGAFLDKKDMGEYITFQHASYSREKGDTSVEQSGVQSGEQSGVETNKGEFEMVKLSKGPANRPANYNTFVGGDINTTPTDEVPSVDLSLDSFTKYVNPSEPIMLKVKSSNAYLWNTSFVPSIFNGGASLGGRFNSKSNYIPPSVCSNLLISNILMSLDATLYNNQKLKKSFGGNSDNKESDITKEDSTTNKGSIYNLLEHPMRKYYPMVDLNPFDINVQMYGQKFSDWTQFFIGSDKNEDKSIYITSTNEGGVITLRDSYLYTLMSDKETDADAESCHKFYCNKPRCFEITKQCSKYPSVLPNKVFVDHKYIKSTCQCSELDGLMPVQQKTDDGKDPKYWMVHFMENKKLNKKNKSNNCSKERSPEEVEMLTGINKDNADSANMDEQLQSVYAKYLSKIKSLEGQMNKIYKDSEKAAGKPNKIENTDEQIEYSNYIENIKDQYSKSKFEKILEKWTKLKSKKFNPNATNVATGGSQFTQELSDLFGKWSTNLRNKQKTGHTYYVPIEYMDTTTGKKFEIEDILIDPVHSRIKVEGIDKSIAFTEEKLKEVVEMYMNEMRSEERRKNALDEEERMKHTLSFSDYMTYKKTNDKSNFDDQDEVISAYDTLDEANAIMNNQSGGGKYVNIDGEKVILKIGKNEKYITKTGRLVSVKDYKNKNNYVELMTIDGEPMRIKSKNKEYYLQKDGTLIKCKN